MKKIVLTLLIFGLLFVGVSCSDCKDFCSSDDIGVKHMDFEFMLDNEIVYYC